MLGPEAEEDGRPRLQWIDYLRNWLRAREETLIRSQTSRAELKRIYIIVAEGPRLLTASGDEKEEETCISTSMFTVRLF